MAYSHNFKAGDKIRIEGLGCTGWELEHPNAEPYSGERRRNLLKSWKDEKKVFKVEDIGYVSAAKGKEEPKWEYLHFYCTEGTGWIHPSHAMLVNSPQPEILTKKRVTRKQLKGLISELKDILNEEI